MSDLVCCKPTNEGKQHSWPSLRDEIVLADPKLGYPGNSTPGSEITALRESTRHSSSGVHSYCKCYSPAALNSHVRVDLMHPRVPDVHTSRGVFHTWSLRFCMFPSDNWDSMKPDKVGGNNNREELVELRRREELPNCTKNWLISSFQTHWT